MARGQYHHMSRHLEQHIGSAFAGRLKHLVAARREAVSIARAAARAAIKCAKRAIVEAKAAAEESMEKAKNWANGDFGYIKRNQDLIDSLK